MPGAGSATTPQTEHPACALAPAPWPVCAHIQGERDTRSISTSPSNEYYEGTIRHGKELICTCSPRRACGTTNTALPTLRGAAADAVPPATRAQSRCPVLMTSEPLPSSHSWPPASEHPACDIFEQECSCSVMPTAGAAHTKIASAMRQCIKAAAYSRASRFFSSQLPAGSSAIAHGRRHATATCKEQDTCFHIQIVANREEHMHDMTIF